MADENRIQGQNIRTQSIATRTQTGAQAPARTADGKTFAEVLRERQAGAEALRFSGHAQARLASRQVSLTESDLTRLKDGVDRAAAKGGRESLVLLDDLALVVSVRNQTVITVMDGESRKGNVFTNIDSAVIV